ncbi:MAG: VOC family protein [Candidatus Rokubacteria bacterium]|nr:VOC family protein [Candidatus Rokubacteria bacterium]
MKKKSARAKRKPAAKTAAKKAAKARVSPIPRGYHTVTPQLTVRGAVEAIGFYKRAFGARELMRMAAPDGKVMHAELRIGDSVFFLGDEFPETGCRSPQTLGGATGALHVYVRNVDAAVKQAADAGAQVTMPVADMFWGDRYGKVRDPFGHEWGLATHKEDLTPAQQRRRGDEFMKQMGQHG